MLIINNLDKLLNFYNNLELKILVACKGHIKETSNITGKLKILVA